MIIILFEITVRVTAFAVLQQEYPYISDKVAIFIQLLKKLPEPQ